MNINRKTMSNEDYEEVCNRMEKIILDSFTDRPMPSGNITENSINERLDVLEKYWNVCYGELLMSKEFILDSMYRVLIGCIDGQKLETNDLQKVPRDGHMSWGPDVMRKGIEKENRLSILSSKQPTIIKG
jgi:hypothetical protein